MKGYTSRGLEQTSVGRPRVTSRKDAHGILQRVHHDSKLLKNSQFGSVTGREAPNNGGMASSRDVRTHAAPPFSRSDSSTLTSSSSSGAPATSMPEHVRRHIERVRKPGIRRTLERYFKRVAVINGLEPLMKSKTDEELKSYTRVFRERLSSGQDTLDSILPEAFAVVREAARRTLGLRHYDVQLVGGMVLQDGLIAEMMTGEGKTLMATLPAYLNALEGKGVHVVTVNDYLAKRDCELMGRVYGFLGVDAMYVPRESDESDSNKVGGRMSEDMLVRKRRAFAADITYVTSTEICFDFLRSNTASTAADIRIMRPFNFCIVDEADFVLIDSALQPMLLSDSGDSEDVEQLPLATEVAARMVSNERIEQCIDLLLNPMALEQMYLGDRKRYGKDCEAAIRDLTALGIDSQSLRNGDFSAITGRKLEAHYSSDKKRKQITLTDNGAKFAESQLGVEDLWSPSHGYARLLEAALRAKEHYLRDRDYIVKDDQVVIIDPGTGRAQPRTRWREMIHSAVECKEGLKPAPENEDTCSITYQAFFRLYRKLSGMSGTAQTEEEELFETYGLSVVPVPTNKPMQRIDHKTEVYKNELFHNYMVTSTIEYYHKQGRPILVGTGTVDESEKLAAQLDALGIPHEVLNARPQYEEQEAGIIAQAGSPGAVTISTNMAGRGTDIVLGGDSSGLVLEHLRVWLMMRLDLTDKENREAHTKFINRLRKRITPPTPIGYDVSLGPYEDEYCTWDFLFPLLQNPFSEDGQGITSERASALGYLSAVKAAMTSEESTFTAKDIQPMIFKAMEIKELIKIRVRSLLSMGLLKAAPSGSSEYILLKNSPEDWDPIFGVEPNDASLGSLEEFADERGRDERAPDGGIRQAMQQYSRTVQALGKAAYILEVLLNEVCDRRARQVRDLGGLLVLSVSMQSARRLENQLRGRAGRQGDPGETRSLVSLDDPMMLMHARHLVHLPPEVLLAYPDTGQLIDLHMDWENTAVRPVQNTLERFNYGVRADTRAYGDVLGPYSAYMYDMRRRLLLADRRDARRMIHSLLQFKADELVAQHLGPKAAATHPSHWAPSQLAALQDEVLKLMAPSLENTQPFATSRPDPSRPAHQQTPTIYFFCSPELADRANLFVLVSALCSGQPIQPILPTGPAGASLIIQSLFQERWALLSAASGIAKELPPGSLPLAPLYVQEAVTETSKDIYESLGVSPDPDPWKIRHRPEASGRYFALYEMLRLLVGDLLIASYEERYATASRETNYINADTLYNQGLGKHLNFMTEAWKRFLSELEELKTTVMYRAYASLTPLEEYRIESAVLFKQMIENIRRKSADSLLIFDFVLLNAMDGAPSKPATPPAPSGGTAQQPKEELSTSESGNGVALSSTEDLGSETEGSGAAVDRSRGPRIDGAYVFSGKSPSPRPGGTGS